MSCSRDSSDKMIIKGLGYDATLEDSDTLLLPATAIDTADCEGITFSVTCLSRSGADVPVYNISLYESDDSAFATSNVVDSKWISGYSVDNMKFIAGEYNNVTKQIGYVGHKRYIKIQVKGVPGAQADTKNFMVGMAKSPLLQSPGLYSV